MEDNVFHFPSGNKLYDKGIDGLQDTVHIADNYGHQITVFKNRYNSIDELKQIICSEMNGIYRPANLRLLTLGGVEIREYDLKDVSSIKIVIVPIVCNSNICISRNYGV